MKQNVSPIGVFVRQAGRVDGRKVLSVYNLSTYKGIRRGMSTIIAYTDTSGKGRTVAYLGQVPAQGPVHPREVMNLIKLVDLIQDDQQLVVHAC